MYWNDWGIHRFAELWCLRRTEDERQYCHQHINTQQICGAVQALSPIRGIVYHHAGALNDSIPYLLLWGSVILISFVGLADFVFPLWSIIKPRQSIILTSNAFYPWWVQQNISQIWCGVSSFHNEVCIWLIDDTCGLQCKTQMLDGVSCRQGDK